MFIATKWANINKFINFILTREKEIFKEKECI